MRKFVIGGNWKLQINSIPKTVETLQAINEFNSELDRLGMTEVDIFLAIPYTSLFTGQTALSGSISLAAQNVHYDEKGPYTGEISIEALKEFNVEYILIGHSERRIIFGEKDSNLNKKVHMVLKHGLTPVLCIGETAKQRAEGKVAEILTRQLQMGLMDVSSEDMAKIIVAYEPVWAINNPLLNPGIEIKAATPQEAENTHLLIRKWLVDQYGEAVAESIRLLYGGSMKPANAEELLSKPNIDGGLIGGASLSVDTLGPIIKMARTMQI